MANPRDIETVERVIPAPPEKIFDLLADPRRHGDIDGSGTVRDSKDGPDRLTLGARFGMNMRMGFRYSMVSEVVEFDENRCIAWQTRAPGPMGRVAGGRIWRYELEPVDGGTRVRESWDLSKEPAKLLLGLLARSRTRKAMATTLERIEEIVTA